MRKGDLHLTEVRAISENGDFVFKVSSLPVHDFSSQSGSTGRSVYLQGQLHANESGAMLALHQLRQELFSHPPLNSVRIVPNANPLGWHRYLESGDGRISANGANWNRIFESPDRKPSRTADQLLAAKLWWLSMTYDVVIDVHTPEYGLPHIYASSLSKRLLTFDDIPPCYLWPTNSWVFRRVSFDIAPGVKLAILVGHCRNTKLFYAETR